MRIRQIDFVMGTNCNFKCSYCHKRFDDVQNPVPAKCTEEVVDFTQSLFNDFLNPGDDPLRRRHRLFTIKFFGGEPLMYFDGIKDLLERLRQKDERLINTTVKTVNTNGSLLTQEMVDVFNEFGVTTVLSHDGPYTEKSRGRDVLNDPRVLDLCRQLLHSKHFAINATISHFTPDYLLIREHERNLFGPDVRVSFDIFNQYDTSDDDLQKFTKEDVFLFNRAMDTLFDEAMADLETPWEKRKYGTRGGADHALRMWGSLLHRYLSPNDLPGIGCGMLDTRIACTTGGDIVMCNGFPDLVIGHIPDLDAAYETFVREYKGRWKEDVRCKVCDVRKLCQGGCFMHSPGKACLYQRLQHRKALEQIKRIASSPELMEKIANSFPMTE